MRAAETIPALGAASVRPNDLRNGVIVILSGGPVDWTNPVEVRTRMDQIIAEVNADPWVVAGTEGKGLAFRLLSNQQTDHIHQTQWKDLCTNPQLLAASPLIIVGHSNGGAAAMNLARFLESHGRSVDFLFTADSVLTLNDNGDPYEVPSNVKLNLNSYSVPVFPIWLTLPFPFGKKNHRRADNALGGILNIGLQFAEPGAIEHRDVFYALAGGDQTINGYKYPELIRDSILALLKGSTHQEVLAASRSYLQTLADEARIPIYLEATGVSETLNPAGTMVQDELSQEQKAAVTNLHCQMSDLERTRLAIR